MLYNTRYIVFTQLAGEVKDTDFAVYWIVGLGDHDSQFSYF